MADLDVTIGANVLHYRGMRSQQSIADAMRERGWKWTQATVWSVEKGERPLRLAEAEDLADVLGIITQVLTSSRATNQTSEARRALFEQGVALKEATRKLYERQLEAASTARHAHESGDGVAVIDGLLELIAMPAEAWVRQARVEMRAAAEAEILVDEAGADGADPALEAQRSLETTEAWNSDPYLLTLRSSLNPYSMPRLSRLSEPPIHEPLRFVRLQEGSYIVLNPASLDDEVVASHIEKFQDAIASTSEAEIREIRESLDSDG